jgi:hypothetical protein
MNGISYSRVHRALGKLLPYQRIIIRSCRTRKSAIVYEFASRCQGSLSIFWVCAESLETIQQGFKQVSHRISLERHPTSSHNRKQLFRDWLSTEHHAKWMVIFDNAHHGLDLRDLLPYKGGKVIITSRHTDVKTDAGFITKDVPPLLPAEATELFLSRWKLHNHAGREYHTMLPSVESVLEDLHDRPLAVVLAASCVASMRLDSAQEHLQILQEEESSDAGHLDKKIWKWVCHLLEELNPAELNLLTLLAIFDGRCISDEFLDSISGGNAGEDTVFSGRQYSRSLQRLISLQLIQRRSDPWKQYLHIPMAIRNCLWHYVAIRHDLSIVLIKEGMYLLHSAFTNTNHEDSSRMRTFLETIYPHCRTLFLSIKQHALSPNDDVLSILPSLSAYALGEATSEATSRCHKQFWRTWLLCNNFNLPESTSAEDDGAQHIDPAVFPSWVVERQNIGSTSRQLLLQRVYDSISAFFMDDIKQCLLLSAIGQSWHGVREEVFQYAKELPNAPQDNAIMREITNAIDNGGCAGLQTAVAQCVRDEGFNAELLSLGRRSINYVAEIITCSLTDSDHEFPEVTSELLESAVSVSLNWFLFLSFNMIGGAFVDLFKGRITAAVCSVIEPGMTSNSNVAPESFESVTAFMVSTLAGSLFRERSRRVSRGYWEVVGAMGLFFAADVLRQLSAILRRDGANSPEGHSSDEQRERADVLLSRAIELTREGVMSLERKQAPGWKLSVGKAVFWCLQAEECRTGWTTAEIGQSYRNQERWEESCILAGMNENGWPLSCLV